MNLLTSSVAAISSTGGLKQDSITNDSILIAYSDLRKVNSKLIELEYEQRINKSLRTIINNDSIAISGLNSRINYIQQNCDRITKKYKKQRNIASGIGIGALVLLIISIL